MFTDNDLGYQVAWFAGVGLVGCGTLLCLYLVIAAIAKRRTLTNWSSCGKCGYSVTAGLARCSECGSDYARVGIVTRAMDQRMRVGPWVAGFALTSLMLLGVFFALPPIERAFPSTSNLQISTTRYSLVPSQSSLADIQVRVEVTTRDGQEGDSTATWELRRISYSPDRVLGRIRIDGSSKRFEMFDTAGNLMKSGDIGSGSTEMFRRWFAVSIPSSAIEEEVTELSRSAAEILQSSNYGPHLLIGRQGWAKAGGLRGYGESTSISYVSEIEWTKTWPIFTMLGSAVALWIAGLVVIYRRQRIPPALLRGPE
jgi:hypothetical protein